MSNRDDRQSQQTKRTRIRDARRRLARFALPALFAMLVAAPLPLLAADAVPTEKDSIAAARAVKLGEKLRCLVCQNQTIEDSNAELAQDLRQQIREQIAAGKTDEQIADYMVARYGDFVLYQPPVKPTTLLLWAGPALLLGIGIAVAFRVLRTRAARPEETPLSTEEHERALRLLAADTTEPKGRS